MVNGFLRVAAVTPKLKVADVAYNTERILAMAEELDSLGVEIAVFPELSVTAYTCADLLHSSLLLTSARQALQKIADWSKHHNIHIVVGLPLTTDNAVYNCAAFVAAGEVNFIRKTYIPTYNEFYERRWFAPAPEGDEPRIIESHGARIGIEICEDLWVPVPPSCALSMSGAEVIFNLSASPDQIGKYAYTLNLIAQQSARCLCGYVYASAGRGESSTDLVFAGKTIIAENGSILAQGDRWAEPGRYVIADIDIEALRRDRLHCTTFVDCARRNGCRESAMPLSPSDSRIDFTHPLTYRTIHPRPFVPPTDSAVNERCEEIVNIQTGGLAQRLSVINCRTLVVGISGGLDSTLALLVAVRTFDRLGLPREGITGVTMPGFGTTDRTYDNAINLMKQLGITVREISIRAAVEQHFSDIGHDASVHDVTYENSQARERTQLLMDIANQTGGIVLGTGDLSELALGWATYNGDHMSMYGVNAGVPKTLVRYLVEWFASQASDTQLAATLTDIAATPISPELTPADEQGNIKQKTEDLVGPYELHDFFLYYTLRFGFAPSRIFYLALAAFAGREEYTREVILKWLRVFVRRFFAQQFKRSCLPDGPKVGSVCLSPRGDWRMPSDASSALWLADLDRLA